jgi:hypothetical protein
MKIESQKSHVVGLLKRILYTGVALGIGIGAAGCFYSRTVDTEPAPIPQVVQVPQPAPVVVQTTAPTVPTVDPEQHQVTTSWGPDGTVQKQTTTIADPNGPIQKQTTTTWQPGGAMQSQTTTTTSAY